ncbi:MAG TPA: glycosyltransferase family 4 protein [Terriglobia bacterium]|nr:glycosyltransferase family 4 protein [Terriglobia bacterium]
MTNVLIIVEDLPVPFDRRVWQEACALRDAGYEVSVVCPKREMFTASRETLEGIKVYRHSLREGSGPLGYLLEYLWALAAQFVLALGIYRRTRFRVIHACNPPDTIFLVGAFFKLFGVRFIFDHHDLNPELFEVKFRRRGVLYRLVWLAERLTYRTADVSIATNASYRQVAIERGGMRPERVFVVRSSPDLSRLQLGPPSPALKQGRPYLVLYLGTMGPQEGVDLFLEAAARIMQARNDAAFVVIGQGSEVPRLKALAARLGLGDALQFTGRVPDAELAEYLCTADVCVAPDPRNPMNDKSTMNKILQYMAYGRPVVLFDLTEGRRAAGDAALYAQPNDPGDFARNIVRLLDSEPLRRELGDRGRRRIEEDLNWDREKAALLAAYRLALGDEGAAAPALS